jgi:ADP-ribosylglycohydrolase
LAAIRKWGATRVVTLVESDELAMLGVPHLGAAMRAAGLTWHHLPVRDVSVPGAAAMTDWRALSPLLHAGFERGERVLLHCRGGLGRAGTIAALLMVERGADPATAIAAVRAARPGAIETREQETWLGQRACWSPQSRGERAFAALLGGAIGDSLGADVEFMSDPARIAAHLGEGAVGLPLHQGVQGAITDDTQMTLFTAEGLARARTTGRDPVQEVHRALLDWLSTQRGAAVASGAGLAADSRLCHRRAPGMTCLQALTSRRSLGAPARNDSKGCGTIMRVAPVAFGVPRADVLRIALATSALTHGHPTGQWAAAAWAGMIADVADGAEVEEAALAACALLDGVPEAAETLDWINRALAASPDGQAAREGQIGEGWVAEEALAIALYANLCSDDPETVWRIAVVHGGDSDSTGAIAGNLMGARHPSRVRTHRWAQEVECADRIGAAVKSLST